MRRGLSLKQLCKPRARSANPVFAPVWSALSTASYMDSSSTIVSGVPSQAYLYYGNGGGLLKSWVDPLRVEVTSATDGQHIRRGASKVQNRRPGRR